MSHLSRELERQLVWIEAQAGDLQRAIDQLVEEGNSLMAGYQLWDETQADAIRHAINDWADNCGRSIASTRAEVTEFRTQLNRACR